MEGVTSIRYWILNFICCILGFASLLAGNHQFAWNAFPLLIIYLLFVPGFTLMQLLGWDFKFEIKNLIYSIALSILFIILSGLFINYISPTFLTTIAPLSPASIRIRLFSVLMPFVMLATVRTLHKSIVLPILDFNVYKFLLSIVLLGLPVSSALGAYLLNYSGNNLLSIGVLIVIVLMYLIIVFYNTLQSWYPWIILSFSLSLLWLLSIRSANPVGWDIATEMVVFNHTKEFGRWIPAILNPAYNACLSITIFPTILSAFLPISSSAVYKILFPLIFSFVPVCGYQVGKKIFNKPVAFSSAFYMISQPFFIQPMVGLARQMIALFFFAVLLMNLFSDEADTYRSKIFNYLLVTGMVLSHYSTSYIAIFFLGGTYLGLLFYKNTYQDHDIFRTVYSWLKIRSEVAFKQRVSFSLIGYMFALTFIWYSQVNLSGTGVFSIISNTISSLTDIFVEDVANEESQGAAQVFTESNYEQKFQLLGEYVESTESFFDNTDIKELSSNDYPVYFLPEKVAPANISFYGSNYLVRAFELVKTLFKAMIPIGSVLMLFLLFRKSKLYKEFIILTIFANFIITLLLFHPTLGRFYNFSRLSVQSLVFLSLTSIYGLSSILAFVHDRLRVGLIASLIAIVFILNHGILGYFIGGNPYLHLYNLGGDYNKVYYHDGELLAAKWLSRTKAYDTPIFADAIGNLRLIMGGNISGLTTLIPSVVYEKSYVYLRYTNIYEQRYSSNYGGGSFSYTFNNRFFDENKNLVYSNPESKIYR